MSDSDSELQACELGTKEYWDDVYKTDKKNFDEFGEAGEIWFGRSTLRSIIQYISSAAHADDKIIDLGCGNGMLLIELDKVGFKNLFGVDYSEDAITLATSVAQSQGCSAQFNVCDLVNWKDPVGSYEIAVDKGTYDAISLDSESVAKREKYLHNVSKIIASNGLLILTTCNWSEEEIINQISKVPVFRFKEKLAVPEFKFGGKSGSRVTTVIFEKSG